MPKTRLAYFSLLAATTPALATIMDDSYIVPEKRLHEIPSWAILCAILGVALVVILVGWLTMRFRANGTPPPPRLSPDEEALRALDELLAENLPVNGEIRQYYQRISDILREYVEARFEISAPNMTTEEFIDVLRANENFQGDVRAELMRFMNACDKVKYAGMGASAAEMDNLAECLRNFILATRATAGEAEEASK